MDNNTDNEYTYTKIGFSTYNDIGMDGNTDTSIGAGNIGVISKETYNNTYNLAVQADGIYGKANNNSNVQVSATCGEVNNDTNNQNVQANETDGDANNNLDMQASAINREVNNNTNNLDA